jgi:16S rRNA (adenine1518-N6/adenine1519-N6)-dimethyltransferase
VRDARPEDHPSSTREILQRHGLRAKKSWGQNFLVDARVQERIVAAATLSHDDVVVEIGAGLGALTRRLVAQAGQTIAIEHDGELAKLLEQELGPSPGLRIERADALVFDFAEAARAAGRPLVVVGNLPFQIAAALCHHRRCGRRSGDWPSHPHGAERVRPAHAGGTRQQGVRPSVSDGAAAG